MPILARRAMVLLLCSIGLAYAADNSPPAGDNSAATAQEPAVTIIERGQERVEEFRINNRVYMIKITPAKGYPYYLVDTNGDGNFDTRSTGLDPKITIPQWVLFKWK
jgi:hypothetical protein